MAGPRRRPRHPDARRRLQVRFTAAEYATVRDAAARPGRGVSLSRFVADAALTAAQQSEATCGRCPKRGRGAPSRLVLAEVMEATAAVNRVGNNLNQLARARNTTGLRPVGSREVEQRVLAALVRLAEAADRAAGADPDRPPDDERPVAAGSGGAGS